MVHVPALPDAEDCQKATFPTPETQVRVPLEAEHTVSTAGVTVPPTGEGLTITDTVLVKVESQPFQWLVILVKVIVLFAVNPDPAPLNVKLN